MSNKRLTAATIPDNEGPIFDGMEEFQGLYLDSKFKHFPIKQEFLERYAEEFQLLCFPRVKFYPDFVTEDGTHWFGVRVAINGIDCRVLFAKGRDRHHEDGTVSSQHVALYYDAAGKKLEDKTIRDIIKAMFAVLLMAKHDFRH